MYQSQEWKMALEKIPMEIAKNRLKTWVKVNGKLSPPIIPHRLSDIRSDFLKERDAHAKTIEEKNIPLMCLMDVVNARRSSMKSHTPRSSVAVPIEKKQKPDPNQLLSWRTNPCNNNGHIEEKLIIPPEKKDSAIGKHLANVNRLEKTHGVRLGVMVFIPERGGHVLLLKRSGQQRDDSQK